MITIFELLFLFQLKHYLADYLLQGKYMLGKFKDHPHYIMPLLAHVSVHGMFTAIIVGIYKPKLVIPLALLDMTIHFIMDRIKASPKLLGRYKALSAKEYKNIMELYPNKDYPEFIGKKIKNNTYFWYSLGLDQSVHHLTHYLIIYLVVS